MKRILYIVTFSLCLLSISNNTAQAQHSYTSQLLRWTITMPEEWQLNTQVINTNETIIFKLDDENYIKLSSRRLTHTEKQSLNTYRRAKLKAIEDHPEQYDSLLSNGGSLKYRVNEYSEPIGDKRYQVIRINMAAGRKKRLKVYVYQWDNDLTTFDATIVCNNENYRKIMRDAFVNAVKSF